MEEIIDPTLEAYLSRGLMPDIKKLNNKAVYYKHCEEALTTLLENFKTTHHSALSNPTIDSNTIRDEIQPIFDRNISVCQKLLDINAKSTPAADKLSFRPAEATACLVEGKNLKDHMYNAVKAIYDYQKKEEKKTPYQTPTGEIRTPVQRTHSDQMREAGWQKTTDGEWLKLDNRRRK